MDLSFVIPCFRESEQQLNSCLDSLMFLNDLCEWEAWIIDDGSPQAKVEEWVSKRHDEHLHTLRQDNQGQSVARNVGIEKCCGEYIAFVDADDELIGSEYAKLVKLLLEKRPDALGLRYKETKTPYFDGDALYFMEQYDIVPSVCAYIIKREQLGDLRFTPGIYHEDEEFCTMLHTRINRLIMTTTVAYKYNCTAGSTITSRDEAHLEKRFNDYLGVIKRVRLATENEGWGRAMMRRTHVLAMCFIVNLIRDGYSSAFIKEKLKQLRKLHLYPLPAYKGIRRYAWIRLLTRYPWMVVASHKILRRS